MLGPARPAVPYEPPPIHNGPLSAEREHGPWQTCPHSCPHRPRRSSNRPCSRRIVGVDTRNHNPRVGVRVPPPAFCDVSGYVSQVSRDVGLADWARPAGASRAISPPETPLAASGRSPPTTTLRPAGEGHRRSWAKAGQGQPLRARTTTAGDAFEQCGCPGTAEGRSHHRTAAHGDHRCGPALRRCASATTAATPAQPLHRV